MALVLLADLHHRVQHERLTGDVDDAGEHRADALVDVGRHRQLERQHLFRPAAQDAVEECVRPHRHAEHLEDGVVADRDVVAHELAERPLGPPHVGQEASLDHDLGRGRHLQIDVLARSHLDRLAGELRRHLQLVHVVGDRRGGGEEHLRRRAEQHGRLQRAAHLLGFLVVERQMVARRQAHAKLLVADVHRAVEREVRHARLRLARQEDGRGEVRRGVALGIGEQRQVAEPGVDQIRRHSDLALEGAVAGRERGQLVPLAAEITRRDAEDLGQTLATAVDVGQHGELGSADMVKEDRLAVPALRGLCDGGQLVPGLDLTLHLQELTPGAQLLHVLTHDGLSTPAWWTCQASAIDVVDCRPFTRRSYGLIREQRVHAGGVGPARARARTPAHAHASHRRHPVLPRAVEPAVRARRGPAPLQPDLSPRAVARPRQR